MSLGETCRIPPVCLDYNSLHLVFKGRTPNSILQGIELEDIPVKSYHTLFCPIYALDARLQDAGGAGPPKWEPRSKIGVYLGHSPLHAGIVALVWNPTTGRVSPQYHVVFDDDFSTVPYMEAGTWYWGLTRPVVGFQTRATLPA